MKMTRQEKIIWSLFAGVLILLFLLSSTDLIIKEKKTEIYPVSVIIGETTDDYYTNFRKGVDKAADEYNVDVNFITCLLYTSPVPPWAEYLKICRAWRSRDTKFTWSGRYVQYLL